MSRVERQLRKVGNRLKDLREELRILDEQVPYLLDDADDLEIRAAIQSPGAAGEYREARLHVDAHARHRARIVAEIADLEKRIDDLLDKQSG